jgi:four helix bundle protein
MANRNYEDLEVFQKSYKLAISIHEISLKLPKYELYEEGNQIRRSSKSIVANIVEGFGRRRYKKEFLRFLIFSQASCDETKVHLKMIFDLGYINEIEFKKYFEEYEYLGRKLNHFIKAVEKGHIT